MKTIRLLLAFSFVCLLCGCGGGGTSGVAPASNSPVKPSVSINWPLRSRGVTGSASALSAVIVFQNGGVTGTDVSFSVDRDPNPAAYSKSYTSPTLVRVGSTVLQVRFQADSGGTGGVVANASASVQILGTGEIRRADGSALGTIQSTGSLQVIHVDQGQSVTVGGSLSVLVSATDKSGNIIAISPGSVNLSLTNGSGTANIDSAGNLVGSQAGIVTVTATVDGITSPPQQITVLPVTAPIQTLNLTTNDLKLDTATGRLWASIPGNASKYANSVVEIDPATLTVISSVYVGSEPGALAISDDGTALYVGLNGASSVRVVDLASHTASTQFALGSDVFVDSPIAYDMAVQPGHPNILAVNRHDMSSSGGRGPAIYIDGVKAPNQLGIYEGDALAFTSSGTLWSGDIDSSPPTLYKALVDSTGATKVIEFRGVAGGWLKSAAGQLYCSNGQVFDGQSGSLLGTLTGGGQDVAIDSSAHRAWFLSSPFNQSPAIVVYDTSTYAQLFQIALPQLNFPTYGNRPSLTRLGAKGLAFRTADQVVLVPAAPGL